MKKIITSILSVAIFFVALHVYADDGDLIVDGKLGVGTDVPLWNAKLHVVEDSGGSYPSFLASSAAPGTKHGIFAIWNTGDEIRLSAHTQGGEPGYPGFAFFRAGNRLITITSGGRMGILMENPSEALHVNGNVKANRYLSNCSLEYKKDITDFSDAEAVQLFKALKPVKYKFKDDKDAFVNIGFIAEDTPDLLKSADKKSISQMDLIAVLTKVVGQQDKRIKALEYKLRENN